MVLHLQFEKLPLKKGKWSAEEDQALIAYIKRYGIWNWNQMPKAAGLLRSGKSCRLRWVNYLRPNLKHGNFTEHEDEIILALHQILGNKWSVIAAELPGRSDNEIKNRWNSYLKKRWNIHKSAERSKVQRKEAKSAENQISYFTVIDSSSDLNLCNEDEIVFSGKFYQHLDHYLQDQETIHTDSRMLIDDENISTSPSGSSTSSNCTMWPYNQMNEEINVGLFALSDELVPNMWEEQPFLMDYV